MPRATLHSEHSTFGAVPTQLLIQQQFVLDVLRFVPSPQQGATPATRHTRASGCSAPPSETHDQLTWELASSPPSLPIRWRRASLLECTREPSAAGLAVAEA